MPCCLLPRALGAQPVSGRGSACWCPGRGPSGGSHSGRIFACSLPAWPFLTLVPQKPVHFSGALGRDRRHHCRPGRGPGPSLTAFLLIPGSVSVWAHARQLSQPLETRLRWFPRSSKTKSLSTYSARHCAPGFPRGGGLVTFLVAGTQCPALTAERRRGLFWPTVTSVSPYPGTVGRLLEAWWTGSPEEPGGAVSFRSSPWPRLPDGKSAASPVQAPPRAPPSRTRGSGDTQTPVVAEVRLPSLWCGGSCSLRNSVGFPGPGLSVAELWGVASHLCLTPTLP